MRSLISILFLFLLISCTEKEKTEILYNKYDPEYSVIQAYAQSECIRKATVLDEFNAVATFSNSRFQVGDIFELTTSNPPLNYVTFFKINAINTNDIEVIVNSTTDSYDMNLVFTKTSHERLVTFLKGAICNDSVEDYFSTSGTTNSNTMSFTWMKETISTPDNDDDGVDEVFNKVTETLSVTSTYPLFMYFFNGSKKHEYSISTGTEPTTQTATLTLKEVTTDNVCNSASGDYNSSCEFSSISRNCELEVDEDAYLKRAYASTPLDFTAGSDSDCTLPEHGGVVWDSN